jgi:Sugar transferases involved in lipopolysaccharide synthesis
MTEIGSALCSADALLVHLQDSPLFEITLPSKIQAYLAMGRPIIMAVRGDAARLLEQTDAGIACIPEDAPSIAAAVERLVDIGQERRDEMGRNWRKVLPAGARPVRRGEKVRTGFSRCDGSREAIMAKRFFDLSVAIVGLLVIWPIILLLALLVRLRLGSPVFFRQTRPGMHGKLFEMVKFRSMTDARDATGNVLPDADRLPPFGKFLRSSSLDELPELINVIKGDMSLVGPRPLLVRYLGRYTPEQARRHEVKPGITGWAQINGRNAISWEEKFNLDVWYVDHQSFWLDLKILWMTFAKVFKREGICQEGQATMERFRGTVE